MNTPDKETKGQGWKQTLESWETNEAPSGWDALQQRVPSGRLFRLRQWVEGSAVKVARSLGKATLVKVAAVATLTTAVPSDLAKQQPSTVEPSTQIVVLNKQEEVRDTVKNNMLAFNQEVKVEAAIAILAKKSTPEPTNGASIRHAEQTLMNSAGAVSSNLSEDSNTEKTVNTSDKPKRTTQKNNKAIASVMKSNGIGSNRRDSVASTTKLNQPKATYKSDVVEKNSKLPVVNNYETNGESKPTVAVSVKNSDYNSVSEQKLVAITKTEKQNDITSSTIVVPKPAVDTNTYAISPSIDSAVNVSKPFKSDSLVSVANADTTVAEAKKQRDFSLYGAISAGGGVFSSSSISGGFVQIGLHAGAYYGKLLGARFSAGVSSFQAKLKGDSTMVADTDGVFRLKQGSVSNQQQQLTFGLDFSQRIWGNELTNICALEGVRGVYRLGESPVSGSSTKFTPMASARLSVAIYRRTRYGFVFFEPSVEYQMKDIGSLPKGMSCFGLSVGWCF